MGGGQVLFRVGFGWRLGASRLSASIRAVVWVVRGVYRVGIFNFLSLLCLTRAHFPVVGTSSFSSVVCDPNFLPSK